MKSDQRTRALILALCIAPVATPLLVAGINSVMKSYAAPAASPVSAPPVTAPPAPAPVSVPVPAKALAPAPRPLLRATFDDPFLSPNPMGAAARLEATLIASAPQIAARPRLSGSHVLREVSIVDGLQISAEGLVIALAGVAPVPPGSECRRLDGVMEPCALRAANRLDVLTRGRPVVCDLQEGDNGDLRGACRAGKIDLADDLVRHGLAVRTSDRP